MFNNEPSLVYIHLYPDAVLEYNLPYCCVDGGATKPDVLPASQSSHVLLLQEKLGGGGSYLRTFKTKSRSRILGQQVSPPGGMSLLGQTRLHPGPMDLSSAYVPIPGTVASARAVPCPVAEQVGFPPALIPVLCQRHPALTGGSSQVGGQGLPG